jgi:hypothetical protein
VPEHTDQAEQTDQQEHEERGQEAAGSESGLTPEEIEEERARRLDPDNRPERAEVDNTQRDFDPEKGMYTDAEGYESAPKKFAPEGEQGA